MPYTPLQVGQQVSVTVEGWVATSTRNHLSLTTAEGSVYLNISAPESAVFSFETLSPAPALGDLGVVTTVRGESTVVQFRETGSDTYVYAWLDAMGEEYSGDSVTPVSLPSLLPAPDQA